MPEVNLFYLLRAIGKSLTGIFPLIRPPKKPPAEPGGPLSPIELGSKRIRIVDPSPLLGGVLTVELLLAFPPLRPPQSDLSEHRQEANHSYGRARGSLTGFIGGGCSPGPLFRNDP